MADEWHALSLKQPWAALLSAGVKGVEVRTWGTRRRGPLLVHASKVPDERPEGWAWLTTTTPALRAAAELRGGVVGVAELTDCVKYATADAFLADRGRHLNAPEWFRDGGLFGLVFCRAKVVPFHPVPGNTFFFPVAGFALPKDGST